jgi:hypothetical protein
MTEYALGFMRELGFDGDAIDSLCSDIQKIYANDAAKELFSGAISEYESNIHADYTALRERADAAGELVGVHPYSAELLLFICYSKHLRTLYREQGISDRIWYDSMSDLKWKLWECKKVKGIWGSFVAGWFPRFFNMTRFALGRLQFEIVAFKGEYQKDGKCLKDGDPVINVHIPRTLTPLDKESRENAYAQAKAFFSDKTEGAPMAFVCSSWLLFPKTREILPEHSNIRGFMSDYDIIRWKENEEGAYPDMWRLFDMDFTGDVNDYPEDSSLRRAFKKFLLEGNRAGSGYGVFFA